MQERNRYFWLLLLTFFVFVVAALLAINNENSKINSLKRLNENLTSQIRGLESYLDTSTSTFYAQSLPFRISKVGYVGDVRKGHITFEVICPSAKKTYYIQDGRLFRLGYPESGKELNVGGVIC